MKFYKESEIKIYPITDQAEFDIKNLCRKTDKIKIREEVLAAVENHRIELSRIDDEKTLQYIAGFKRYSTERVMKSLVGEFTQNEKWSVKGTLMGECWYKDGKGIC